MVAIMSFFGSAILSICLILVVGAPVVTPGWFMTFVGAVFSTLGTWGFLFNSIEVCAGRQENAFLLAPGAEGHDSSTVLSPAVSTFLFALFALVGVAFIYYSTIER